MGPLLIWFSSKQGAKNSDGRAGTGEGAPAPNVRRLKLAADRAATAGEPEQI